MKKILIVATSVALLTACDLDVNKNPNYPEEAPATMLLPAVQNSIAVTVGDGMYNYAGFFAQYYDQMPEANQYNTLCDYTFTESSQIIDRSYRTLYAGALADINGIFKDKNASDADKYVATVLRTFCFQLLVDNMDQAPYKEILQGNANSMPKWDAGQEIYEGVLAELDEAESKLTKESAILSPDLLLSRDLDQWKGYANALRLRMYLRFVDAGVDAANYTAKIKALVDKGVFFTGDIKFDAFSDEKEKRNPWYACNKVELATNHVASYPIVTYMKSTKDPRIAYSFLKAANVSDYAGELPGSKAALSKKNADYSALNYYATKPVYFFTQSELQFLLSEVYLRFYSNDAKAEAAYIAGIDADFSARGMTTSASVMYGPNAPVAWSTASDNAAKLELIYMQKWVALCYMDHMEAWSEIRRTDCPKLSSKTADAIFKDPTIYTPGELIAPMRNGLGTGMVKRMFFPLSARQLNKNTPAAVPLTTGVWWDKK
ncbi:SusD/RagB family nutrient-binding outer membrane lipoprotein [Bacteroides sedimenti]|uniref:SusD/RagB family nutrient-binding outer membrane lipoprotein n=1 Tax=Bacteroides sedimenti TaxID=2136147 RepID=A0ABM8IFE8_9BACE